VTVQGSDIYQAARMPLMGGATRQGLRGAGRVFALSSDLARATTALRLPPGLVHVLPNGVDIDRFVPGEPTREPIILSVGSLIARKAVDVLIEAVAGLTNERPWRLVIIGDGGERSALEAQVARLGLGARVQFPGNQDQATVAEWMRRARVFVLPSREEGLGVVLLEALASGTPCVGSAVGGIPDVVVPEVGALVPPDNPAALTTALHAILGDDERWRAMSRAARERAEACYSWPVIARELMATYESVVEQRR
jgi:glycosyltransferase involved in cell wall biosynthesis